MRRPPFAGRGPRDPRHVLRTTCHVVRLRDLRIVADCVLDVSRNGLLVGPTEAVLTGEPLLVLMELPHAGGWLDASAVVTRVMHGRRPGEWSRCLGIEFDEMDEKSRRGLERTLGIVPPAPPRARPGRRGFSPHALARLTAMLPPP